MEDNHRGVGFSSDIVLRSYVDKNTPKNAYRAVRGYHLVLIGVVFLWLAVRCLSIVGSQVYGNSDAVLAMLPVEVRAGAVGALICVIYSAFDLTTLYGLVFKERWGWWLGLLGLCWGITLGIGDALISLRLDRFSWTSGFHLLIAFGLVLFFSWMIKVMLSSGMRAKFGVEANPALALACTLGIAVILGVTLRLLVV